MFRTGKTPTGALSGAMRCAQAFASLAAMLPLTVSAQDYPTRSLRMFTMFAAGSQSDLAARFTAGKLSEQLGVAVVVENRGGAGLQRARLSPGAGLMVGGAGPIRRARAHPAEAEGHHGSGEGRSGDYRAVAEAGNRALDATR